MYYPKSQIKTNLYTNGGEYIYASSKDNYIGFYWRTSSGKIYTGKTPQDLPINELLEISPINDVRYNEIYVDREEPKNDQYNNITSLQSGVIIPPYSPSIPTDEEYRIGEFRRYFCKKTNELIYIEINKQTYLNLINKDPNILWQLYFPFYINWQLIGNKQQVAKTNLNAVNLISFRLKLSKFNLYLKEDYTKFYKSS